MKNLTYQRIVILAALRRLNKSVTSKVLAGNCVKSPIVIWETLQYFKVQGLVYQMNEYPRTWRVSEKGEQFLDDLKASL